MAALTSAHPSSPADEVPAIFLSHSGKQKPFVENLYNVLQTANHIAFFDKHTLPKGSRFPPRIIQAARGCKLGVVVLSEDFLTSKWPMLELEMLVLQRDREANVLPVFYKLCPQDLKSSSNLTKWRDVWKEIPGLDADKCHQAVKALNSFNGEVFVQGTSEVPFIRKVVDAICKLVSSPISHDLSQVRGHQRFAKEVASQFDEAARQCDKVCMVGLYGVGGLGKTTMCEIMCDYYISKYLGKSCHIEFPSDGDDKKIVQECKKALRKLANLSDEHVLNRVDRFNEVIELMRQNLGRHDVFLAIDNVWERSLEAAKRILDVNFSVNSKILLTSRSDEVLQDLVRGRSNTTVAPLPSPDEDEAFHIFQDTFELAPLQSLVNSKLLGSVLKRCFFSGKYHALALKALGRYVKRVCRLQGLNKIEDILCRILQQGKVPQNDVHDLIRLNYVSLAAEKQHIFLDIVVVMMEINYDGEVSFEQALLWLHILYKEYDEIAISNLISELGLDGLIQLENIVNDDVSHPLKMIRVHDLYFDLAQREAAGSARFFQDRSPESVEEIKWESLERVILTGDHDCPRFIEELQQHQCPKLQVFCAEDVQICVLNVNTLVSLQLLQIRGWESVERIKGLDALKNLRWLHVKECRHLRNLDGLSGLLQLECISIEENHGLEKMPDLSGLTCLERLELWYNRSMEEVVGGLSPALKYVEVSGCDALKKMPDLSGLTCLERLQLVQNRSMEEVVGGLSPALKHVEVGYCVALKKMPDLSGLTCLECLELWGNGSMEEVVGGLSPALKHVEVCHCDALKKMPDLSGLTCLERLELWDNGSMEEVVGGLSPALKHVEVHGCDALKKMPDLSGLTCLERLELWGNGSMEEVVGGLSPALKHVDVRRCDALKKMPDLSGLTCLERLKLRGNGSMEEVVGGENWGSTLKHLCIRDCGSLRRFPSLYESVHLQTLEASVDWLNMNNIGSILEKLPNLQELHLIGGEWTTSVERLMHSGVPDHRLQSLTIQGCDSLLKLDVECLPCSLERFQLKKCLALEEMGDLRALHSLNSLTLKNCPSLKKLGALCVQTLEVYDCPSLEKGTIPDVRLIPHFTYNNII